MADVIIRGEMKMRWVLEDEEDTLSLRHALSVAHTPYTCVTVRPFSRELIVHGVNDITPDEQVFVRGPFGLPEACLAQGWRPVIWTGEELDERAVSRAFSEHYLNHDGVICKLKDVENNDLPSEPFFIKPASDTKTFSGQIVSPENVVTWRENMIRSGYLAEGNLEDDVFFASVKPIGCEWRFFIVNGEVVTGSCYKQYQRIMPSTWVPDEAWGFVKDMVSLYNPLPGYVMDITQIPNGEFRVLELNTLNHAGLYSCDVDKIVSAVNETLLRYDNDTPSVRAG